MTMSVIQPAGDDCGQGGTTTKKAPPPPGQGAGSLVRKKSGKKLHTHLFGWMMKITLYL